MKRRRRVLFLAGLTLCTLLIAVTTDPVKAVVVSDDFSADANYAFGAVGGIWQGSENMLNLNGGVFNANLSNPGVLTVDDNGTFDPNVDGDNNPATNPAGVAPGVGWEGGRSSAPFLWREVPANQDFTATVKISAQTSGQWSAAGIVARAKSPTPPGPGDGNVMTPDNNSDENFVTMTTFRTDAANADEGNTLNKRVENGVQVNDNNILVNATGTEPLPMLLRLERVGGGTAYRGWVSTDGGATYQFQSRVVPTAGNPLRDGTTNMEVGLAYQNFGTVAGTTQFDDFVLDTYDPLPAPGAPNISASQTAFTVTRGTILQQLITDSTGGQGPLSWVRTPNLPGADSMQPGTNGGSTAPPLPPFPPFGQSFFRWDTLAPVGTYMVTINATNDWGQASNAVTLTITIIPEPATLSLAGAALVGIIAFIRRRR
jgi:hypothetical protein